MQKSIKPLNINLSLLGMNSTDESEDFVLRRQGALLSVNFNFIVYLY